MIRDFIVSLSFYTPVLLLCLVILQAVYSKYGSGINHIPGPWQAAYTDWWRFWITWKRRPELEHIRLHEQHGDLVRLGPRAVSVADPEAIKIIYALNAGFVKSDFYPVQQVVARGTPLRSMFNTTDEKFHAKLRRAVSNAYAMSSLVQFEPLVDSTTTAFLKALEQRYAGKAGPEGVCNFGQWLQFYAFDVIGELTYSKRLGFVDHGIDVDSIIANLEKMLDYVSIVGQIPWLDKLFKKNPVRLWLEKQGFFATKSPIAAFTLARMKEKEDGKTSGRESSSRDFLSRFLEAHEKDPSFIDRERVTALTVANMFAGSDTTAISLRAIFYHLLKNPDKMMKLLRELADEEAAGHLTRPDRLIKWDEARDLPYLSAVIKEALRCHPAAGLPLERIVPSRGITVCGQFIPGGTIVGCSAWVVHRNERVFGHRTEHFRPERWLEVDAAKSNEMNGYLFTFGAGARTCIGKNVSYLEMYKLVPAVLRTFKLELVHAEKSWTIHNAWFVKQEDFNVRLTAIT